MDTATLDVCGDEWRAAAAAAAPPAAAPAPVAEAAEAAEAAVEAPPRQPTLFISHGGGPCWLLKGGLFAAMDSASPSATFIRGLARHLPAPPAAVLVISAHWEAARGGGAQGVELLTGGGSGERHALFYDYYGFPREAYGLEWSPPAAPPALVARVRALLTAAGFAPRESRTRAGLDHGVFLPLMLAFPAAEVPVLQLSLLALPSPAAHLALGAALAPLRDEGVLIVGSGFATHNIGEMMRGSGAPPAVKWAVDFDAWLAAALLQAPAARASAAAVHGGEPRAAPHAAVAAALARVDEAPHFARAHPTAEHLLPLHVALGAAAPLPPRRLAGLEGAGAGVVAGDEGLVRTTPLFSQIVLGSASFASYKFE